MSAPRGGWFRLTAWRTWLGPDEKTQRAIVKSNGTAVDDVLREVEVGHVPLGPHPHGISIDETRACVGYACEHLPTRWRDRRTERGARLPAGRTDLKTMFRHHTSESQIKMDPFKFNPSKLLLAIYAVECGLKSVLLKQLNVNTTDGLEERYLTHDLNVLSVAVYRKKLFLEQWNLASKGHISLEALHQALRYGLRLHVDSEKRIIKEMKDAIAYIEESL